MTTAVSLMAAAVSDTVEPRAPVFLKVSADLASEHPQSVRTATRSRPARKEAAVEGRNRLAVLVVPDGLEGREGREETGTVTTPAPVMEDVRSGGQVPPLREIPWDLVSRKVLVEHAMEPQLIVRIATQPFRVR